MVAEYQSAFVYIIFFREGFHTFKELLKRQRLMQAANLLEHTKLPITEIIERVGYDNTSYFHRKFKERHGVSPKEYRAQHQHNK